MTGRTVTLPTLDHGTITLTCPPWCTGHENVAQHCTDIRHTGPDEPLTLATRGGPVTHLITTLEQQPFPCRPPGPSIVFNLYVDGDWYPTNPVELHAVADALSHHASVLHARAHRLQRLRTPN